MAHMKLTASTEHYVISAREWDSLRMARGVGYWSWHGKDTAWVVKLDRALTEPEFLSMRQSYEIHELGTYDVNEFIKDLLPIEVEVEEIITFKRGS